MIYNILFDKLSLFFGHHYHDRMVAFVAVFLECHCIYNLYLRYYIFNASVLFMSTLCYNLMIEVT